MVSYFIQIIRLTKRNNPHGLCFILNLSCIDLKLLDFANLQLLISDYGIKKQSFYDGNYLINLRKRNQICFYWMLVKPNLILDWE